MAVMEKAVLPAFSSAFNHTKPAAALADYRMAQHALASYWFLMVV